MGVFIKGLAIKTTWCAVKVGSAALSTGAVVAIGAIAVVGILGVVWIKNRKHKQE